MNTGNCHYQGASSCIRNCDFARLAFSFDETDFELGDCHFCEQGAKVAAIFHKDSVDRESDLMLAVLRIDVNRLGNWIVADDQG